MRLFAKFRKRHAWTLDQGVTENTRFADIAPFVDYLKPTTRAELKKAAEVKYGSPWALTLGNFFDCIKGNFQVIGAKTYEPVSLLALQYFWVEAFRDFVESLTATLDQLKPPAPKDAEEAAKACKPMEIEQGITVFCREYFGLHRFSDVRGLYISDLLLARKDVYNKAAFNMARSAIEERKRKAKK